jgi:hypothetical protein
MSDKDDIEKLLKGEVIAEEGTLMYAAPLGLYDLIAKARGGHHDAARSMLILMGKHLAEGEPLHLPAVEYFLDAFGRIFQGESADVALNLTGVDKGRTANNDEVLFWRVEDARTQGYKIGSRRVKNGRELNVYAYVAKQMHTSPSKVRKAHERVRSFRNAMSAFPDGTERQMRAATDWAVERFRTPQK